VDSNHIVGFTWGGVETVWLRNSDRIAVIVCGCIGLALGASGCISDDTSLPITGRDASAIDAAFPTYDASGTVDGAGPGDATTDAPGIDASVDSAVPDAAPVDAGDAAVDASTMSQIGLVAGGTVGHSTSYTMTGTTGPATAPVLRSPSYQLVGGMSATSQKP
jgi:hypothetical protein